MIRFLFYLNAVIVCINVVSVIHSIINNRHYYLILGNICAIIACSIAATVMYNMRKTK